MQVVDFPEKLYSVSCEHSVPVVLAVPLAHEVASVPTLNGGGSDFLLFESQFFLENNIKTIQVDMTDDLADFFGLESDAVAEFVTVNEVVLLLHLRVTVFSN